MLRDLVLYTIFMFLVLAIIYGHVNVHAQNLQKRNVEAELLGLPVHEGKEKDGEDALSKVRSIDTLWEYLINDITPRLIPNVDAITKHPSKSYFLMTHARLRQVRIGRNASERCLEKIPRLVWPRDNLNPCIGSVWGEAAEETRHFDNSWEKPLKKSDEDLEDSAHRYWTEDELNTAVFVGEHGVYSGGGYIVTLYREDPQAVQNVLKRLVRNDWIDRLTRCVLLEFTVYNPSTDMYTQVVLSFELDRYGTVLATKTIHTAALSSRERKNKPWLRMAEASVCVLVLFYVFKGVNDILHGSLAMFFSHLWNWVEFLVSVMSLLCVIFYLFRLASYEQVMKNFDTYGHGFFLDFTQVFHWHHVFHISMAFFGAFVILKMVKVTSFNPFTKVFMKTMFIGRNDVAALIFCTVLCLLAFGCLGRLLFGGHSFSYSSLSRTLITLLFFILGEPHYAVFLAANEILGKLFFVSFMVLSQCFVINLFIAVLRESLELSRCSPFAKEKATIRYMIDATMMYFNLTARNRQRPGITSPYGRK
ncbi:polycystic kidney disease 2-like 1 protein [Elysia marginata]|uniref:Polycystic kidney disease 2-like 1 protein n=1 Tax=Elysia marginata TaxID=1093978 RepID=A0AAV4GM13_9GAST|nr:polycystic kidney disease 2-like 1 protein [Elysia marginata]